MHNRQIDIHTYFSIINAIDLIFSFSEYLVFNRGDANKRAITNMEALALGRNTYYQ